jgi:hypothetical protein
MKKKQYNPDQDFNYLEGLRDGREGKTYLLSGKHYNYFVSPVPEFAQVLKSPYGVAYLIPSYEQYKRGIIQGYKEFKAAKIPA